MATWVIREKSGQWEVSRVPARGGSRREFGTEDEALRYLHQHKKVLDKIVREEDDGYRIPLRRRRHWRR